ncbi:hypothetical protein U9M48_033897 [Paspalum notatum var. saurae]|uniref:FRIGIDA-like protein n=1 Tax=Paspalum notatum var. saurae TaxID=547442 RepID=A0AAQ3X8D2_PASNO
MPQSCHGPPAPMAMAMSELEAAVAALPGRRDALREAYGRLASCSPSPLPFAWEDLDAHLSSLHSSISLRFRQLQVLEAARTVPAAAAFGGTRGDGTTRVLEEGEEEDVEEEVAAAGVQAQEEVMVAAEVEAQEEAVVAEVEAVVVEAAVQEEKVVVEQKADEEMQESDYDGADDNIGNDGKHEEEVREELLVEEEEVEEEAANDKIGNATKDEKVAREEEQASVADEHDADEMQLADELLKYTKNPSHDKEEDANVGTEEQDTDMEKASAMQGKEEEACSCSKKEVVEQEEQEAHKEQDAKNTTKVEEVKANEVSWDKGNLARPGGFNDLAAACASMDTLARRLVRLIHTNVRLQTEFRTALRHVPDRAALSLRVVELFLHDKMIKTNRVWANYVGLIRAIPEVVTNLSTESIEQAKRVAKDWKEMVDNPGSCMVLGNLASWSLLYFLITYNIVSEFDIKEIFHLFSTVPRRQQSRNSAVLFNGLGLTDKIPELMDYLIGNGQLKDVLYLARVFKVVEKYTPLSVLKGCVEKAKQTVIEISQENMTCQSLSAVVIKEIHNLRKAKDLAKEQIMDSNLCTSITAEINILLDEFGQKKRSLADASTTSTSNSQQQQTESNKKRKKEQEHHKGQETQQQGQASKLEEEPEKKQNKPQQEQQQKQEGKPPETQPQIKQKQSKRPRQHTPKRPTRASPAAWSTASRDHFGHPPYATMHHQGYSVLAVQPGLAGNHFAVPIAPQLGAPGYMGPFNPFYYHPEFYPL